jgi:hypothetical protein
MKSIEGCYGTPAHSANPGFRAPQATRTEVVLRERWQRDKQRVEQATSNLLELAPEHRALLALE